MNRPGLNETHRHGADLQFVRRAERPDRDLTAIGDQYLCEYARLSFAVDKKLCIGAELTAGAQVMVTPPSTVIV